MGDILLKVLQSAVQESFWSEHLRFRIEFGIIVQGVYGNHQVVSGSQLERFRVVTAPQFVRLCAGLRGPTSGRIDPQAL